MSIQRYKFQSYNLQHTDAIVTAEDGDMVKYTDHAAEVERLTAERDAARSSLDKACEDYRVLSAHLDTSRANHVHACEERDAAVARVETLENGILSAMDYWNRCEEPGAMSDALYEIENRLNAALAAAPDKPQGE